jgi:hypothetical protein
MSKAHQTIGKPGFQGYNKSMWKKLKKVFSSTAFNIFLIVALAAAVIYFTMRKDGDAIMSVLSNVSIPMVIGMVCLMVLE